MDWYVYRKKLLSFLKKIKNLLKKEVSIVFHSKLCAEGNIGSSTGKMKRVTLFVLKLLSLTQGQLTRMGLTQA